jgi:hypothetical protein
MSGFKLRPIVVLSIAVAGMAGATPPIRQGSAAHPMTSAQAVSLASSLKALSRLPMPTYVKMSDAQKWAATPPMKFSPEQFSSVGRHPPIRFKPFTEAEVVKMAKQANRYRAQLVIKSKPALGEVQVHKHDFTKVAAKDWQTAPVTSVWVGVSKYVEEINEFEKYLNRFGRSLREKGPTDMGVVARAAYPTDPTNRHPSTRVPGLGDLTSTTPAVPTDPNQGVELPDWQQALLVSDAAAEKRYCAASENAHEQRTAPPRCGGRDT